MQDESVIKITEKESDRENKDKYIEEKINLSNREAAIMISIKAEGRDKEMCYL
jgi:hypothetical protein